MGNRDSSYFRCRKCEIQAINCRVEKTKNSYESSTRTRGCLSRRRHSVYSCRISSTQRPFLEPPSDDEPGTTCFSPTGIPDSRIRLLIADDHALMREGLEVAFVGTEIEIVAETVDGEAAFLALTQQPVDVALIDISMPRGGRLSLSGTGACRSIVGAGHHALGARRLLAALS